MSVCMVLVLVLVLRPEVPLPHRHSSSILPSCLTVIVFE